MFLRGLCAFVFIAPPVPSFAQEAGDKEFSKEAPNFGLTAGPIWRVRAIVDGDTVVLENGEEVRLTGIQAPKLPLGRKNFPTWPFADAAKVSLSELTLGKQVQLFFDGRRMDRYGRILAHLQIFKPELKNKFQADSDLWVQGALVAQGLARVYSFADNRRMTPQLLRFEHHARRRKQNIWTHSFYSIRTPETLAGYKRTYQLVEGTVLNGASVRKRIYLNFGADWKTDFTIQINPKARRLFLKAGLGPEHYEGKRIRVRGWIDHYNGPMIRVSHPEQIEIIQ